MFGYGFVIVILWISGVIVALKFCGEWIKWVIKNIGEIIRDIKKK